MKSSFFRLFLVRWLVVLAIVPGLASAQTMAVPSRMQMAISNLIQSKALKRGFAPGDSRLASTLQSAGVGLASAAAAAAVVTAAGVTAPAWITAGISVGLSVLFSAGLDLAIDGIKWLINGDGSVSSVNQTLPYKGQTNWIDGQSVSGITLNDYCLPDVNGGNGTVGGTLPFNYWCIGRGAGLASAPGDAPMPMNASILNKGVSTPGPQVALNLSAAIPSLTSEQLGKPLNPLILATIADNAWKKAASQPGYTGLPYDAADPITVSEAQAAQAANASTWPTVGDAVAPQVATGTDAASSPWALPVASTAGAGAVPGTTTGTDTATESGSTTNTQSIDWGVFSAPALEETPTTGSIIDPLLNLWPAWASFSFPQHQSVCPTPSFTLPGGVLNGRTVHFTQMCDFLESNNVRVAMQAAFAMAWAILIVFIVMGA